MFSFPLRLFALAFVAVFAVEASGATPVEQIQSFTNKYCLECHSAKKPRGELDLSKFSKPADITSDFRRWTKVVELIRHGEMPPEDAKVQPPLDEQTAVIAAVESILMEEAKKHAGDPGVILSRRLSRTEFDQSVRDLTGVDVRPLADFPPDPAGGEGFDNTGEALTMSPSLLKKCLAAAENASNYLVLKTDGIEFAPFPVTSYNEQKKLTEQAIIDYYRSHDVKTIDYLEAAWRYRHRLQKREITIEMWAKQRGLSEKYLALVRETLQAAPASSGYLKQLGELWNAVPAPTADKGVPNELDSVEKYIAFCRRSLIAKEEQLIKSDAGNWPIAHLASRARTAAARDRFDPSILKSRRILSFDRIHANPNQTKETTYYFRVDPAAANSKDNYVIVRRSSFSKSNGPPNSPEQAAKDSAVSLREFLEKHAPETATKLSFGNHPAGRMLEPDEFAVQAPAVLEIPLSPEMLRELDNKQLFLDCELDPKESPEGAVHLQTAAGSLPKDPAARVEILVHPESQRAKELIASSEKLCATFPNRFFYVDNERGLAAGFHLVEGFFRDDQPLMSKVLDESEQRHVNRLWEELDFVTQSAETLLRGFVWFERAERHVLHDKRFDFLRAEDPQLVHEELLGKFERLYLEKLGVKLVDEALEPVSPSDQFDMIHGFFQKVRRDLAHHHELMQSAEAAALENLQDLAERAYHRPLRPEDKQSLLALYRKLRAQHHSVEDSLRGVFAAVLMSPDFCYRLTAPPAGVGIYPLTDVELAGRLSYFLWSSLPDEELLKLASEGKLQDEATLIAEARRMREDPKIESFAREFFGQWLRYRDYLTKDSVTAEDFPGYGEPLREAMFAEPTKLAAQLIRDDRPITDLLNSDATFVNGVLAKHYGGKIAEQYNRQKKSDADWLRVEGLREQGRGGLFGMSVILAKNAAGGRTSPIKRGFWTVHHLLGQHFPPPPADIPELPKNEKDSTKTIRELIVDHTAHARCAMCHTHFDSLGMALEGFDPIGRARTKDLAGRAVDDLATFPDGKTSKGIPGLIEYVESQRRDDFVRTLCRKFLGYALGRSVELSDQILLNEMEQALKENDYRFSVLFEMVVKSEQFRKQRGRDFKVAEK